jgi:hypothetical protein
VIGHGLSCGKAFEQGQWGTVATAEAVRRTAVTLVTSEVVLAAQLAAPSATARALNSAAIYLVRGMRSIDRQSGLTAARLSAFFGPKTHGLRWCGDPEGCPLMQEAADRRIGAIASALETLSPEDLRFLERCE